MTPSLALAQATLERHADVERALRAAQLAGTTFTDFLRARIELAAGIAPADPPPDDSK